MLTQPKNAVEITFQDMRNLLIKDKGWTVSQTGNEFLFTYKTLHFPIEIKVLSGIDVKTSHSIPDKEIRVYAIAENGINPNGKINFVGLASAKNNIVHRIVGWQFKLKQTVIKVIKCSKFVYKKKYQIGI